MATIKFDKDVYKKCEEAVFTFSIAPVLCGIIKITNPEAKVVKTGKYTDPIGHLYIAEDAPIGKYTIEISDYGGQLLASDTMTVIGEVASPDPTQITRAEFMQELQKRGIIDYKSLPHMGISGEWHRSTDGVRCVKFSPSANCSVWVIMLHLSENNPPTEVGQIAFKKCLNTSKGENVLSRDWVLNRLDALPFITDPLCLWLNKVGIENLSVEHVLYIFFLALGAEKATEVVYEYMTPKKQIDAELTWDHALGVYFYLHGAVSSGNLKTGCKF